MMNKKKRFKVIIAIPTINCSFYIYNSLERIKNEVLYISEMFKIEIVIGLNGTNDQGESEREIKRFIKDNENTPFLVTLLIFKKAGKNITINKLVDYSKNTNADIIHFLDDDVMLKSGSLLHNLKALIQNQEETDLPILVGSHFYVIPKRLSFYLRQNMGIRKGLLRYFWHCVFRVAFESEHDSPQFCSGQSLGMFVSKMPVIPGDDKGVMDDCYLSYYAYVYGKVIKPENSKVFFNVADSLDEWQKQQTRIHLGVLKVRRSFIQYEKKIDILSSWPYSHNKKWRMKPKNMSLKRRFFYMIYLYLSDKMAFKAEQNCNNLLYKDWASPRSSKLF